MYTHLLCLGKNKIINFVKNIYESFQETVRTSMY
jgi:hypothetical protein